MDAYKEKFIEERFGDTRTAYSDVQSIFNSMRDSEERMGCDYSLFDFDTLQEEVNKVIRIKSRTSQRFMYVLREYVRWREENGLPFTRNIFEINIDLSQRIEELMIESAEDLQNSLDTVFDPPYLGTSDCVYRTFLWLGFMGLDDKQALLVSEKDIDFQKKKLVFGGVDYPIPECAIYDFFASCALTSFMDYMSNGTTRVKSRSAGTKILRTGTCPDNSTAESYLKSTIRPTLARKVTIARRTGSRGRVIKDLSFKNVCLSGIFIRLYAKELNGEEIDFNEIAQSIINKKLSSGRTYKLSSVNTLGSIQNSLARQTKADYLAWKQAFHY